MKNLQIHNLLVIIVINMTCIQPCWVIFTLEKHGQCIGKECHYVRGNTLRMHSQSHVFPVK